MAGPTADARPPAAPLVRWSTEAPGPRLPGAGAAKPRSAADKPSAAAAPARGYSRLLAGLMHTPGSGGGAGGGAAAARGGARVRSTLGGGSLVDSLAGAVDRGRAPPAAPPAPALSAAREPRRFPGALRPASSPAAYPAQEPRGSALGHARQPAAGGLLRDVGGQGQAAAGSASQPAPAQAPKETAADYMARLKQELPPGAFARIEELLRRFRKVWRLTVGLHIVS